MADTERDVEGLVERLLKPNGDAGDVEVETGRDPRDGQPYPIPVCQYFAAQAGPYKEGTPVVVMSDAEAEELRAEIRRLRSERDTAIREAARRDEKWMEGINAIVGEDLSYGTEPESFMVVPPPRFDQWVRQTLAEVEQRNAALWDYLGDLFERTTRAVQRETGAGYVEASQVAHEVTAHACRALATTEPEEARDED